MLIKPSRVLRNTFPAWNAGSLWWSGHMGSASLQACIFAHRADETASSVATVTREAVKSIWHDTSLPGRAQGQNTGRGNGRANRSPRRQS